MAPPKKAKKEVSEASDNSLMGIAQDFYSGYTSSTSNQIQLLDAFTLLCVVMAGIQFAFRIVVGTFPKNSFYAGMFCSIGSAVLTSS